MQWVWRCAQSLQHSEVLLFFFPLICWLSEENCYDDCRCVNKQIFIDEVAVIEFDLNL